jgi:hypothetical protein
MSSCHGNPKPQFSDQSIHIIMRLTLVIKILEDIAANSIMFRGATSHRDNLSIQIFMTRFRRFF